MKIAIPLFGTRVSPRFDYAHIFLVLEVENGRILQRQNLLVQESTPVEKIRRLAELEVDTFICNGIDRCSQRQLVCREIKVFSWITGEAEDVLRCFLDGKLESCMMMGPGGRCCGRWRFRPGAL